LYKRLAPRLPGLPLQWLQGYGQATGVRWQEFLEQLARQIDSPEAIGLAQDAAQATFLSFRRWVLDEA
ncbi:TPA: biliverdin-producing heme oxygenase, partial [Pseudomonas aeruginosa]